MQLLATQFFSGTLPNGETVTLHSGNEREFDEADAQWLLAEYPDRFTAFEDGTAPVREPVDPQLEGHGGAPVLEPIEPVLDVEPPVEPVEPEPEAPAATLSTDKPIKGKGKRS